MRETVLDTRGSSDPRVSRVDDNATSTTISRRDPVPSLSHETLVSLTCSELLPRLRAIWGTLWGESGVQTVGERCKRWNATWAGRSGLCVVWMEGGARSGFAKPRVFGWGVFRGNTRWYPESLSSVHTLLMPYQAIPCVYVLSPSSGSLGQA